MINKYAEINDRILLYNACKGILRVKQASIGDFIENNISRPIYDALKGNGAYNKAKFIKMDHTPVDVDYSKTNPNISPALAERAKNYKNFKMNNGMLINAVPSGGMKYMPSAYRSNITAQVRGSVIPRTNEGADNITERKGTYYYDGKRIRKPRRMESRKRSIESYYAGKKNDWRLLERMADNMLKDKGRRQQFMSPMTGATTVGGYARDTHSAANEAIKRMDADLARRQQLKQQQQEQRKQRAAQQRAQYKAQKQQDMQL